VLRAMIHTASAASTRRESASAMRSPGREAITSQGKLSASRAPRLGGPSSRVARPAVSDRTRDPIGLAA
jgi:hypothetical protein